MVFPGHEQAKSGERPSLRPLLSPSRSENFLPSWSWATCFCYSAHWCGQGVLLESPWVNYPTSLRDKLWKSTFLDNPSLLFSTVFWLSRDYGKFFSLASLIKKCESLIKLEQRSQFKQIKIFNLNSSIRIKVNHLKCFQVLELMSFTACYLLRYELLGIVELLC